MSDEPPSDGPLTIDQIELQCGCGRKRVIDLDPPMIGFDAIHAFLQGRSIRPEQALLRQCSCGRKTCDLRLRIKPGSDPGPDGSA